MLGHFSPGDVDDVMTPLVQNELKFSSHLIRNFLELTNFSQPTYKEPLFFHLLLTSVLSGFSVLAVCLGCGGGAFLPC